MRKHLLPALFASCAALLASASHAQLASEARLTGFMGSKALIMFNGSTPKVMAVGESANGVKILSIDKKQHLAEVSIHGEAATLRLIGSPSSFGGKKPLAAAAPAAGSGGPGSITIPMSGDGHFYTDGTINGMGTKFMIDTGASSIVLGESDAVRLGINYKEKGKATQMSTAGGSVPAYRVKIDSIVIGGLEEKDLDAVVGSNMPYILLGNSFLSRVTMFRDKNAMTLEKAPSAP